MKMPLLFPVLIVISIMIFTSGCSDAGRSAEKKIIILAGQKSHPPGLHEYIKTARLIKAILDNSTNTAGLKTEIVYNGWPEEPSILDDADLILTISDGRDSLETTVPFMTDERMAIIRKQVERGCGMMTFHYSTFAPDKYGSDILEWTGGYFDWLDDEGKENWYSDLTIITSNVAFPDPDHPVCRGVDTFRYEEEFYFDIRFNENDKRLVPVMEVPGLTTEQPLGKVVAWAIERKDGGRGFGTTIGHYYDNFKIDNYRKLILNAIVWTAGARVPKNGVESTFYSDKEVTELLFGKTIKGLILTGHHHPDHPWQETTPVIKEAIETDDKIFMDISVNIEDLSQYTLSDYDFLVLNYCNWEIPKGLSETSKEAFTGYLKNGGGLIIIHFANGAWHYSLPGAGASDWPEFRNICRRTWDHQGTSAHDAYDTFPVQTTSTLHFITDGIRSFETIDELYYNQAGNEPVEPLLVAHSKNTGKDEPLAWVYNYGDGRIFQTLLGHDAASFNAPEVREILKRASVWVSKKE